MNIIDMHCDTMSCLWDNGGSIVDNKQHINMKKMRKAVGENGSYTQFFAAYLSPEFVSKETDYGRHRTYPIIDTFYTEINSNKITFCRSFSDYEESKEWHKLAAFLSIEGADFIKSTDDVYELYEKGVRCMALTWNYSNRLASGVLDATPQYGLTELGRDVIRAMNKCGMIVDVSHLSDRAFFDVASVCDAPFIASHSNLRSVCANPRNLTEEQFRIICESGGGIGVNLYPPFLNESGTASIDDIKRHIDRILALGGENHIGLGCDFDGVDFLPENICSCEDVGGILYDSLNDTFGETVILKMFSANFERILRKVI